MRSIVRGRDTSPGPTPRDRRFGADAEPRRARPLPRLRTMSIRVLPWIAVIGAAAAVTILLAYRVSISPLSLHPREVVFAVAQAEVLVDGQSSMLPYDGSDRYLTTQYHVGNNSESLTLTEYLQSQGPLERMAAAAAIPGKLVSASGPYTEQLLEAAPALEQVDDNYRLLVDIDGNHPMMTLYGQAPTERAAAAIVASARHQLIEYVSAQRLAAHPRGPDGGFMIRSLGGVTGGTVDQGARLKLMGIVFGVLFLLGGGLVVFAQGRPERRRRARVQMDRPADPVDDDLDLWPHTRRFLPWCIAVFIGVIFLVPIDAIMGASGSSIAFAPTVDRIVLAALGLGWLGSLRRPGSDFARPRLRFTRIHVVVLVFIAIAFLSVGVNGQELSLNAELMPSIKKLLVLVTFFAFFVIAASVLRPGEVRPLLKLMVVLGVICALGTLLERQTRWDIFYAPWIALHVPLVKPPEMDVLDDIGRLGVVGPTSQPLELATLLALVLPPAIVFTLESRTRRQRIMWLTAVGFVLGGAVATARKTSVVAPFVGLLVLCAYRPRVMLRALLVSSLPLFLVVHVIAPGQLGSVLSELEPSHATAVSTDKVRVQRYDAVRPDVMSHLLLGNGYGSYDPLKFRYVDNEYLGLLITAGILGMFGLLAIFGALITLSHPMIRGPDEYRSSPALALQAMVVIICVCSALFDSLSFGHVSYMFFTISAMLVAMRKPSRRAQRATQVAEVLSQADIDARRGQTRTVNLPPSQSPVAA